MVHIGVFVFAFYFSVIRPITSDRPIRLQFPPKKVKDILHSFRQFLFLFAGSTREINLPAFVGLHRHVFQALTV